MPECPPGVHSAFDFCPGDCTEPLTVAEMLEDYGVPEDVIDGILSQHAHELAEKIRLRATDRAAIPRDRLSSGECRDDWAADLIDPEVS